MTRKTRNTVLSLFLFILIHGSEDQKHALQAQADVPAIRRKMPCRRRCYGRQIIRRW